MKPKRLFIFLLFTICWTVIPASASRLGDIRVHARFLTDRMAYELKLSNRQYNDVFEINYDFFYNVDPYINRMSYGDPYALDMYYRYLDERNDDLRWVLSRKRYRRFMSLEHFFLPIYAMNHVCYIRIYNVYPNRTHFYYGRPSHYFSYHGGHCRHHLGGVSFYKTHYHKNYRHSIYTGNYQSVRTRTRHRDFPEVSRHPLPNRAEGSNRIHSVRGTSSTSRNEHNSSSVRPTTNVRPSQNTQVKHPAYTRPTNRVERRSETSGIRSHRTETKHTQRSTRPSVRTESRHSDSSSRSTVRQRSSSQNRSRSSHAERSERRNVRER